MEHLNIEIVSAQNTFNDKLDGLAQLVADPICALSTTRTHTHPLSDIGLLNTTDVTNSMPDLLVLSLTYLCVHKLLVKVCMDSKFIYACSF